MYVGAGISTAIESSNDLLCPHCAVTFTGSLQNIIVHIMTYVSKEVSLTVFNYFNECGTQNAGVD